MASGTVAAMATSRSESHSTRSSSRRSTSMTTWRLASSCARNASGAAGAGASTPSYSTPYRAMNCLRTAQNCSELIGQGTPWLAASYLP